MANHSIIYYNLLLFSTLQIDGSSYAYVNLNLEEKELEELGDHLRLYHHLRFLNLSKNQLKNISELAYLPYLLTVNASEN